MTDEKQVHWYAVMVKSRHEKWVAAALKGKGYVEYLPLYQKRHYTGKRMRTTQLPLFPNYVFSQFDAHDRLPILTIPGVFAIVQSAGQLAGIEESEIDAIRRLCESDRELSPWPYGAPGSAVEVVEGPLAGVRGTLVSSKSKYRLVVSVNLLHRSVSVEIDACSVRPLRCAARPGVVMVGQAS